MIQIDREVLREDGTIPEKVIEYCVKQHIAEQEERLSVLEAYYKGEHKIKDRTLSNSLLPNNKLVINHAEYISDMAVAYVFGNPVNYSGKDADNINDRFTEIDEDSHNNELALDISIYGRGYELLYMNEESKVCLTTLSPLYTDLVVDNTVENKPIFAFNYYQKFTLDSNNKEGVLKVYTENSIDTYRLGTDNKVTLLESEPHYFNAVPVLEFKNNKEVTGDFEGVISLIDAYNLLQSDRVNDKEQLVDALLVISGMSFGDNEDEKVSTGKLVKELKMLEVEEGGDAKWLVKQLNETEIEVLKRSLKDDIHSISKVPNLTDENFVGNSSGVAMKYKLLGFEQLGKTKERYFKQGLRKRLALISIIEGIKAIVTDASKIDITMKRSLPQDIKELVDTAIGMEGLFSTEYRMKYVDGEIDTEEEIKKVEEEKKKSIEEAQKAFGSYSFKGGEGNDNSIDSTNKDNSDNI